ncbi:MULTISPECIES: hypothetical protein [Collimonas]|uniref:Uncharacterized protein n=2 Tax=Collimonas TaxID=202907 RepID=A0A127PXF2_9BURK|nr:MULTISPECIES: hypothetical protein [Collimonas]AMP02052.1 hypothetical protein CAter10_4662 [Collimonas arenae]AMP11947.1 hypothetical protein CAter282_4287 [Collimonas arenae]AMP17201.1 hypothetical protein CPter291_4988 [Collimonas pratensis]
MHKNHAQSVDTARAKAISCYIANAFSQVQPYKGPYTAPWLLSSFDSNVWLIKVPGSYCDSSGEWKGLKKLTWDILLDDESKLTDSANLLMFRATKSVLFLSIIVSNGDLSPKMIPDIWTEFSRIVKWLYLHREIYQPSTYAFARVDANAVQSFIADFVIHGTGGTLNYYEKILKPIYQQTPELTWSPDLLQDPYRLPKKDSELIVRWFEQQNFYTCRVHRQHEKKTEVIDRALIAKAIGVDFSSLNSEKMTAFFRQFEPSMLRVNPSLLIPVNSGDTEYYSHNVRLIDDVINTPSSVTASLAMLHNWERLFRLHHHLPDQLPSSTDSKYGRLQKEILSATASSGSTPWIPLPVALKYTNEALRLVVVHGMSIAKFYIKSLKYFKENDLLSEDSDGTTRSLTKLKKRDKYIANNVPEDLMSLNISDWATHWRAIHKDPWESLRTAPSVTDLLQVLVGAISLLTSILKPMRRGEFPSLRNDCLYFRQNDGYYLRQRRGKKGVLHRLVEDSRPIPRVVALGIEILKYLGDELKQIAEEKDPHSLEALIYLISPKSNRSAKPGTVSEKFIITALDRFCDWGNDPPDKYGRRWYYRPHEGRKTFLISFFWCYKYASLGAASWMANHSSWRETLNYISSAFPGDELPEFEAQYAAEQLWQFEKYGESEVTNVRDLYRLVCRHFNVAKIDLIPEADLKFWLKEAYLDETYEIMPIVIGNKRNDSRITVAVRIKQERTHEPRRKP